MKDQTLKAIDQSVVTAAKFLGDFASDEKKRECLKAFAESTKIVKWIRKETRGDYIVLCVCTIFTHTLLLLLLRC